MGNGESRIVPTARRSAAGQPAIRPRGVAAQSCARIRAAISPAPGGQSGGAGAGGVAGAAGGAPGGPRRVVRVVAFMVVAFMVVAFIP